MDSVGWQVWSQALALADRLRLFTTNPTGSNQKEHISRTVTAWGIFSQQAYEFNDFPSLLIQSDAGVRSNAGIGTLVSTL
jgi:hypothetical protein